MDVKLTAEQHRRIEEIQGYLNVVSHLKRLVAELESNRAASSRVIQNISETLARELAQLRQRALTSNVGTVADQAGAMSVMAGRGGGLNMKIRGLGDGLSSLTMQLEQALKQAATPESKRQA